MMQAEALTSFALYDSYRKTRFMNNN